MSHEREQLDGMEFFDPSALVGGAAGLVTSIMGSKAQADASKAAAKLQTQALKAEAAQQARSSQFWSSALIGGGALMLAGILIYSATRKK